MPSKGNSRGIRVDRTVWMDAKTTLDATPTTHRVTVTIRPGMTRTDAITAFLAAVIRTGNRP